MLAFVILSPVGDWDPDAVASFAQFYDTEGERAAEAGVNMASDAMQEIISAETCAYILDKATELGAEISVEVQLTDENLPVPKSVFLEGNISPYGKKQLTGWMETELGIPEEHQIWTG